MTAAREDSPGPVFIGGFGRSGTHAVGPLVGADPRYHLIETEARFHAVRGGLGDLLADEVGLDDFVRACETTWWERGFMRRQGLSRLMEREELDRALAQFRGGFAEDPWEAARRLVGDLLDPAAERAGKPSWVELTGRSVIYAPALRRLFPRVRFINIVRDGRAVAAGHLKKIDMTDDPIEALENWERMVRASHEGIAAVPAGTVLVIQLDDLVARAREQTFRSICEFLEIDDEGPMRRHFERKITAERAHIDQWRERMPPPEARRVDRRYRRMIRRLHEDGVWWAPAPRDGAPRIAGVRIPAIARRAGARA